MPKKGWTSLQMRKETMELLKCYRDAQMPGMSFSGYLEELLRSYAKRNYS